jgi:hypothetical protein
MPKRSRKQSGEANKDPLTGAPGAHPAGVAAGATGGATAGAAMGAVGGPAGIAIGAAVGGLAGGLIGKGLAEAVNPTVEDTYWQENYRGRGYVDPAQDYSYYQPAYRFGWESYSQYGRRSFDELDETLQEEWEDRRAATPMAWPEARPAARDAWQRLADRDDSAAAVGSSTHPKKEAGRRG